MGFTVRRELTKGLRDPGSVLPWQRRDLSSCVLRWYSRALHHPRGSVKDIATACHIGDLTEIPSEGHSRGVSPECLR